MVFRVSTQDQDRKPGAQLFDLAHHVQATSPRHRDVQIVQSRRKRQEAQFPSPVRHQRRRPSDQCWRAEANDCSGNRSALNIADGSDEHARQPLCGSDAAQQHAGKNRGSNYTENLGGPAGLFIHKKTNELYVADGYFNHRVIVFDADTGKYKRHWGAYGKKPDDGIKFPPRAQLIQGPPPEGFGNPVHAVLVSNDDLVYVGDRTNNRLQVFKTDGTFVKEVFIARNTLQAEGTVHAFATSTDKEQRFLYVVDGSNKAIRVLNRQTLEIVGSIGGHAGHNAREFFHIHGIAADSRGNLFLGEVNNGQRYYKYSYKGLR